MKGASLALLLDLSGDKRAALEWASAILPQANVEQLNKADLKRISKREALARVRAAGPAEFLIFTSDLDTQSARAAHMLFAVFAGARRVRIGDRAGRSLSRTRASVLLLEAPRLALELLAGYALLLPLSWLLTFILANSIKLRGPVRASRAGQQIGRDRGPLRVLYVRATISDAAPGGMLTHAAGFAGGAEALGHRLDFVVSSASPSPRNTTVIRPSRLIGATRTLFELWNNIVFTMKSLRLMSSRSHEIDFIYQRYSRFNWSGVVLSVVTGLPLLLEYNGSEVWISKEWDAIGQPSLLKRFERLNQQAADLILVVSEVERRNLTGAGIDPRKIIVNPNGVDVDRFHPDCGGEEIRQALGVTDSLVVGFVGTFGPWHGAPILAEAASRVDPGARCHFLFVGDGDERPRAESIVASAGVAATFTGRIAHEKVPAYLDSCDVLVSPSVFSDGAEFFGSPTKLFEYMAMARPIVASSVGQIAEVISHGESGLLVAPGDVEALARAIERLARDPELRARLGAAARQVAVDQYTWRHNAARVFQSFEQLSTIA